MHLKQSNRASHQHLFSGRVYLEKVKNRRRKLTLSLACLLKIRRRKKSVSRRIPINQSILEYFPIKRTKLMPIKLNSSRLKLM